jgi:WD40 repeat protein
MYKILLSTVAILCTFNAVVLPQIDNSESTVFKKHNAPVKAVAFSVDGKILATGGDDKIINFWDVQRGELMSSFQNTYAIKALLFTPEGDLLAACGNEIKLFDREGKVKRTFGGYTTDIWSFSYNRPTKRITAGSYAKTIKVWDLQTGKLVLTLEGHERSCLPVCFNPSGSLIASGSLDKSVRLWDATTGQQKHKMELHSENIFSIAFHPSGKYLASASADKTIRIWSADSGKIVKTFVGHKGAVFNVQFSPDGNHMLSCDADKTIILWETATGRKLHTFAGHTGAVNSVAFNHDGSGFASASDDNTVRYWPLDKKYFLEGSYYEKEIEKEVTASPLFAPRKPEESKQEYQIREAEANKLLDEMYDKYYRMYIETLAKMTLE